MSSLSSKIDLQSTSKSSLIVSSLILIRDQATQVIIDATRRCERDNIHSMWASPLLECIRLIATCDRPRTEVSLKGNFSLREYE